MANLKDDRRSGTHGIVNRVATWGSLLVFAILLLSTAVQACDSQFIQEPTWTEPTSLEIDPWAGLAIAYYKFVDGRELIAYHQIETLIHGFAADYSTIVLSHAFRYIVKTPTGDIVYDDLGGNGYCTEIHRVE